MSGQTCARAGVRVAASRRTQRKFFRAYSHGDHGMMMCARVVGLSESGRGRENSRGDFASLEEGRQFMCHSDPCPGIYRLQRVAETAFRFSALFLSLSLSPSLSRTHIPSPSARLIFSLFLSFSPTHSPSTNFKRHSRQLSRCPAHPSSPPINGLRTAECQAVQPTLQVPQLTDCALRSARLSSPPFKSPNYRTAHCGVVFCPAPLT